MQQANQEETRRFWEKVVKGATPGACWIWVGAIGADGYGRFWVKDPNAEAGEKMWRAHRYAATVAFGNDAVEVAEMVTHLCDNPLCVRAENGAESHLFLGDHSENMRERAAVTTCTDSPFFAGAALSGPQTLERFANSP